MKQIQKIQYYIFSRIVFEFPATGGVIPSAKFRTVKLLKYVEAWDYFIMSCEFIFIAFIIYYIIEEALEIRKHGMKYVGSVWNVLDMVVVIVSSFTIAILFVMVLLSYCDSNLKISIWKIFIFQISLVCIGFSISSEFVITEKLEELLGKPDEFADFTSLGAR